MALTGSTKTDLRTWVVALLFVGGGIWRVERGFGGLEKIQREEAAAQEKARNDDRIAREKAELQTRYEFEKIDLRLKGIEGATGDRWSRSDMRGWVREANAGGANLPMPN